MRAVRMLRTRAARVDRASVGAKEIYQTYLEVMKGSGEPVVMKLPGMN